MVRKWKRFVGNGRGSTVRVSAWAFRPRSKIFSCARKSWPRVTLRIDIRIFILTETAFSWRKRSVSWSTCALARHTYSKEWSANSGTESSAKLHIDSRCVPSAWVPRVWSLVTKLVNLRSRAGAFPTDQNAFVYLTVSRQWAAVALEN